MEANHVNSSKDSLNASENVSHASINGRGDIKENCAHDESADIRSVKKTRCNDIAGILKGNILLISVLVCVLTGFGLGFGLRSMNPSESALMWIGLPGEIFMRALYFTIVPLVVSSIISGTATLDPQSNGRITRATVMYVVIVNLTGVLMGTVVYYIVNPARSIVTSDESNNNLAESVHLQTEDIFADLFRNLFPDNVITACFQKYQTKYEQHEVSSENKTTEEFKRLAGTASGTNILGIIVTCTAIGIATGKMGEAGRPIIHFFKAASEMIIIIMTWVIWLTPVGVLSLISTSIAKIEDVATTFKSFGMFILAVFVAVVLLIVAILVAYFIIFRKNPLRFLYSALRPTMAGFAPPSSAFAIPDLLTVTENKYNVDCRISRFCILFGAATIRCGSGAFIAMCSLFLAKLEGNDLQFGQVVSVVLLAVSSTLAVPSIPSSSVVCVIIILSSINVVTTNVGMVMALEWMLDRVRTIPNILSNLLGTLVINKLCSAGDILD